MCEIKSIFMDQNNNIFNNIRGKCQSRAPISNFDPLNLEVLYIEHLGHPSKVAK